MKLKISVMMLIVDKYNSFINILIIVNKISYEKLFRIIVN